jgi:DnaJ domain
MADDDLDYYRILQVDQEAEPEVIQAAYRRLSLKYHPDRNQGSVAARSRMEQLNLAYEALSDPARRASYDTNRAAALSKPAGQPASRQREVRAHPAANRSAGAHAASQQRRARLTAIILLAVIAGVVVALGPVRARWSSGPSEPKRQGVAAATAAPAPQTIRQPANGHPLADALPARFVGVWRGTVVQGDTPNGVTYSPTMKLHPARVGHGAGRYWAVRAGHETCVFAVTLRHASERTIELVTRVLGGLHCAPGTVTLSLRSAGTLAYRWAAQGATATGTLTRV